MNVLIVTSHFPSRNNPTKAIYNKYTFNALAKYCNIYLIAPNPWWEYFRTLKNFRTGKKETEFGITAEVRPFWSLPR